ncbi:hypothetical protein AKJ16_DCAP09639 [Drosera capensis]
MEVEVSEKELVEEDTPEFDAETEDPSFEGESCGICMDIIIDRGVLDCCQHMFCFECIDNWSTITNLCPLCSNEFQLITCVPAYDVFRSANTIEQPISRDNDWCIEGTNSSLSFPSYYINENAVTCLDGDGCRVRKGLVASHEDMSLDTSIACDSCDVWFHAFCVGFDPEGTSIDSWLCPRCLDVGAVRRIKLEDIPSESRKDYPDRQHLVDTSSGKVSISIADTGETAVVVSLIDGEEVLKEIMEMPSLAVQLSEEHGHDPSSKVTDTFPSSQATSDISINNPSNVYAKEPPLPVTDDNSVRMQHDLAVLANAEVKGVGEISIFDGTVVASSVLQDFNEKSSVDASEPSSSALDLSFASAVSESDTVAVKSAGDEQQAANVLADKNARDVVKMVASFRIAAKRKHGDCSASSHGICDQGKTSKARKEANPRMDIHRLHVEGGAKDLFSDDLVKPCCQITSSKDEISGIKPAQKSLTDLMSIVQGRELRMLNGSSHGKKLSDEFLGARSEAAGLRVKKILRRPTEDKESSIVVQKLRKEIRDVVGNKSSEDVGKRIFDPKLLAAFRAVVKTPASGPVTAMPSSILKPNKLILQKGNARENLTKRIYRTSAGKRRHLWVRDFDVEFWKRRCNKATKPEKIDTLKSVLNILRNNSETADSQQTSEEDQNPMLSRLYLADTSVFPRKDDIKPLSVIKASAATLQKEVHSSDDGVTKNIGDHMADGAVGKIRIPAGCSRSNINDYKRNGVKVASKKAEFGQPKETPLVSLTYKFLDSCKDTMVRPNDRLQDMRKLAQEFLARKLASESKTSINKKLGDNVELKQKYPLLGQLPPDMIPQVEPSRLTKIPTSVRLAETELTTLHFCLFRSSLTVPSSESLARFTSVLCGFRNKKLYDELDCIFGNLEKNSNSLEYEAQLYRLTEHFLKAASLSSIRRTAATELAVADAINIEKGFAERSKTKVVYLNLCSQEIRLRPANSLSSSSAEPIGKEPSASHNSNDPDVQAALRVAGLLSDPPSSSSTKPIDKAPSESHESNDPDIEAALRAAGLLSDSPPCTPPHGVNDLDVARPVVDVTGMPHNIFEMDSHPELNIYGDCKYSLEDADYTGAASVNISKTPVEADSKVKLVFSTLEMGRPSSAGSVEISDEMKIDREASFLHIPVKNSRDGSSSMNRLESKTAGTLIEESGVEPTLAECEMLYAPDAPDTETLPLDIDSLKEVQVMKPSVLDSDKEVQKNNDTHVQLSCHRDNSSPLSQSGESAHKDGNQGINFIKKARNSDSVVAKVEAYIKEHIRPLCKSGVITVQEYRWAVGKATDKVMRYHSNAKNANFLIKDGEKVKKLAEQIEFTSDVPSRRKDGSGGLSESDRSFCVLPGGEDCTSVTGLVMSIALIQVAKVSVYCCHFARLF